VRNLQKVDKGVTIYCLAVRCIVDFTRVILIPIQGLGEQHFRQRLKFHEILKQPVFYNVINYDVDYYSTGPVVSIGVEIRDSQIILRKELIYEKGRCLIMSGIGIKHPNG